MTFPPTPEQDAAVALFEAGENMAIEAGAGTGKTSTLLLLAAAAERRGRRGQYIAFNKAIVTEAGQKMPGNMTCSTAHSLAFRAVGRRYSRRLNAPRMKSMEIARRLSIDSFVVRYGQDSKPLAAGYLAGLVMRTIGVYCQTADLELSHYHVPYIDGIDVPASDGRRTYANNSLVREHVMPAVRRAWADLTNVDGALPFRHDHYLKMWQLSGPRIEADFILFDECQDANPVMLDIVRSQQDRAQLVFVGDSQQAIYGFTGAVNALEDIKAMGGAVTFLTQSFRFGQPIADVANGLLARLHAELRLRGTPSIRSIVDAVPDPDVILCRTNACAVRTVLLALRDAKTVSIVGGANEVVAFAKGAADLMAGRFTSHPELACFSTWGEVQEYVEHDEQGGELRLLVSLVDEFTPATIIDELGRTRSEADADVVVSTAHKSKGREWNRVRLAEDFMPARDGGESSPDELRLLYVACTRAKRELDVTAVPHALKAPKLADVPVPAAVR